MRRSYGLHLLFFSCQREPSRGWLVRRLLLPFVSCQDLHGRILPVIAYFYKVYINTLEVCFHWILSHILYGHSLEGYNPLLRVPPFLLNVPNIIGGGSEVFGKCTIVPTRDDLSHPISSVLSALLSGFYIFLLVCPGYLQALHPLFYLLSRVVSKFLGRTDSISWVSSLEVFSLPSFLVVPWQMRSLRADSLLSDGIFRVSAFPPFLWRGEDKIELIEEFVSSVLRGFYCRLTFSRSDFAKWHTLYLWLLFKKLVGVVKEVIRLYSCLLVISTPYYDP